MKEKNQACWCHTNARLGLFSEVPLIPARLASHTCAAQKMIFSVTSFWQQAQVQHRSYSPQIYQWSEMPLACRAKGEATALSVRLLSPTRTCFNDPATAGGSCFSSVLTANLLGTTATHQPSSTCPVQQRPATALSMAETRRCPSKGERSGQKAWGFSL